MLSPSCRGDLLPKCGAKARQSRVLTDAQGFFLPWTKETGRGHFHREFSRKHTCTSAASGTQITLCNAAQAAVRRLGVHTSSPVRNSIKSHLAIPTCVAILRAIARLFHEGVLFCVGM
jgi:hypothetical protein